MATRLRGTFDQIYASIDSIYRALKENGARNIVKWILKYKGTSSGSATEISAPNAAYDGSVEEVSTVAFLTKANSVGSEYLKIPFSAVAGGSTGTEHYFYYDTNEITTVTCLAKASCVASSSFHFWVDNGAGAQTEYYVWLDVSGSDSDPAESGTAIEADISASTTAIDVAEVIDGLINAKSDVSCDNGGTANLPIINANNGNVTNISDGDIATGFSWTIESGGDDPNINQVIAMTCLSKAASTASSSFHFFVADGSGGETEYYIWINKGGADPDPAESGTAIECDISGATTATDVAEIIDGLIDAKTDVSAANVAALLTITNDQNGSVTVPAQGGTDTGYLFIFQNGALVAGASGTAHSCDISGATSAADVGTIVVAAADGVAGISATGTATMTVESDNTGNIDDITQSGSSFGTIAVVNQGRASYEGSYLYIVSGSANDTDSAAGHCREVTIEGFDSDGIYSKIVVAMAGVTFVKLGGRLVAVSHMYGSKFGSGDNDAAGNILLTTSNTANATTLLTIAAGATESNGATIFVPDGQKCLITDMKLYNTTNANTGATIVIAGLTGFEEVSNITPDYDDVEIVVFDIVQSRSDVNPSKEVRIGTDVAKIVCTESEVGIVGNESFVFVMELYTFT
ncbi:hypothetical protein LCGC14_1249060 [marine sediment metagenome]|uniref:Uncharacterized protein n=1 Tax=marine sediment metagenome TaxID=412755 RepID=A0A0F9LQJ7_9ZZZZ